MAYTERALRPGEGKTKLAFLSFSSGTTGKPKAVAIPHYALISNVLQMAKFHRLMDPTYEVPLEKRRFRVGDVALGGEPVLDRRLLVLPFIALMLMANVHVTLIDVSPVLPLFREFLALHTHP